MNYRKMTRDQIRVKVQRAMWEGKAPAFCKECGNQVCTAEPDASWISAYDGKRGCLECGTGTRIEALPRIFGFI